MAFNINAFRSQMVGDGSRPNLFEVSMPFPSFANPGSASTKLTFTCRTASLPGSTVNSVTVPYMGRETKFAGNRIFADWVITVINDEDFVVRNTFERWLNAINSHTGNLRLASALPPTSYTVDANVIHYGKTGNTTKTYKFIGMFPTDVSVIDVDWGANDQFEEFSVTLAYQYWTAETDTII